MREKKDIGIELGRVERGVQLECEAVGNGRYKVKGGDSIHWVDLISRDHPRCDCGDYLWRDAICKHIIAARLREGDEEVLFKVGALVRSLKQRAAESAA
ncbi:MAG TPA: SWIM zinc finger family protein [Gemmatimonadaceae bacterium]